MKFNKSIDWLKESDEEHLLADDELDMVDEELNEGLYVDPSNYDKHNDLIDVVDKAGNPQKMTKATYDKNKGSGEFEKKEPEEKEQKFLYGTNDYSKDYEEMNNISYVEDPEELEEPYRVYTYDGSERFVDEETYNKHKDFFKQNERKMHDVVDKDTFEYDDDDEPVAADKTEKELTNNLANARAKVNRTIGIIRGLKKDLKNAKERFERPGSNKHLIKREIDEIESILKGAIEKEKLTRATIRQILAKLKEKNNEI